MHLLLSGSSREPASPRRASPAILTVLCVALVAGCGGGPSAGSGGQADPAAPEVPDRAAHRTLDVTLYVEDYAGMDRVAEPVRSGVPVPRSIDLSDAGDLVVVDPDGLVVPAQITVTSRWGGAPDDTRKPIKWLLIDFFADVDAGTTSVYRLQSASVSGQGSPLDGVPPMATDEGDAIVVDTGAAGFRVSKTRFNLFDQVTLAGGTTVVTGTSDTGIYVQDPSGKRFLAAAGAASVSIEEAGPLHTVLVARGKHRDTAGAPRLDYTVRMHFWRGRTDSLVAYTFVERSLGSIRSYTALDEVGIDLPLPPGASARYAIGGTTEPASGALTGEAWQRQSGRLSAGMAATFDPGNADAITFTNGGVARGSGRHAPGWIAVGGTQAGVAAAVRWYWQQYPKKLRARPGMLGVELWPSEDVNLRVYAASQKTHEVLFGFHGAGVALEAEGAKAAKRLEEPLVARCNPSWYAKTRVWNRIGVADPGAYPAADAHAVEAFYDNLLGVEFPETFVTRRFDSNGKGHAYGMWDFGDGRENAWSNLAYDTPRSLFIHWALTADRDLLDRGVEAAQHLRDVDIEHSPQDTRAGITDSRGVPEPWLGRTRYNPTRGPQSHDLGFPGAVPFGFEHSKGQGLADHYFLTGDRLSRDVLEETYAYYRQWKVDADSGYFRLDGGTRVVGHMLLVLLGYHDAFGTAEARARIDDCVRYLDDWQRTKTKNDPNGWMWINEKDGKTSTFMNAVTAEALMLYEVDFPDGIPVRDNLVDAARWTIDPANGQLAQGAQGRYFNAWSWDNYGIPHATVIDPMVGPLLGYAYGATGERVFADLGVEVLLNAIAVDESSPFIKAFTQQTRLVPAFFYWLQTPSAQAEAGRSGMDG